MSAPPPSVPNQNRELGGANTGPTFALASPWMKQRPDQGDEHEDSEDGETDERLRVREGRAREQPPQPAARNRRRRRRSEGGVGRAHSVTRGSSLK